MTTGLDAPQSYPPQPAKSSSRLLIGILAGGLVVAVVVVLLLVRSGGDSASTKSGSSATPASTGQASTAPATATGTPTAAATMTGNEEVVPEATSSSDIVIEDVKIDANGTVTVTGNTATANLSTGDIEVTTVYNDGTVVALPIDVTTIGSQFSFNWQRPKTLPSPGQLPGEWRNYQVQIRNKAGSSGAPATVKFQPRSGGTVGGGSGPIGGGNGGPAGGGGSGPVGDGGGRAGGGRR